MAKGQLLEGTSGPNSVSQRKKPEPRQEESRAPGSMAGGWQAGSQTRVSEPRRLSVPPKCDDWRLLACNA